jgi:alkylated DNA repair dioxygenase AlkB
MQQNRMENKMSSLENVPVEYFPGWVRPEAADEAFIRLWDELAWVRHPGVPRREYYVHLDNRPYSYGLAAYARTYEAQPMHDTLLKLWMKAEAQFGCAFETCFLNGYEDGKDHLGWHADDSPEMDDARPILIVTFGAEREIWFRANGAGPGERIPLRLGHGSLCVMKPGMQDTHQHRIPRGDREYGPRISLTFRGYVWQMEK